MGLIKPKRKMSFDFRALGIVFTAAGAVMLLLSVYLLIFGVKTEAEFTELSIAGKNKYYNHYEYTVNGESYDHSERVSKDKAAKEGDTVTVRYLKQLPAVTYNSSVLAFGIIVVIIGAVSVMAGKSKENK